MECPKCKGLMMLERFSDFFLIFYAWKCINCGAIIDRTISNNRRKSLAAREIPSPSRPDKPVRLSARAHDATPRPGIIPPLYLAKQSRQERSETLPFLTAFLGVHTLAPPVHARFI